MRLALLGKWPRCGQKMIEEQAAMSLRMLTSTENKRSLIIFWESGEEMELFQLQEKLRLVITLYQAQLVTRKITNQEKGGSLIHLN